MTVKSIAALKGYFNTGDTPTEANFADLIDSQEGFETVADMVADTTGYGSTGHAEGDIIRAGGFRYEVVADDATVYDLETDGGVRVLYVPGDSGTFPLAAFNAPGDDSTDEKTALEAAIDAASRDWVLATTSGGVITSRPGAVHRFSGRLRIKTGAALKLGMGGSAAFLRPTSTTGGVELEAGSELEAIIQANASGLVGPVLEVNAQKSDTTTFAMCERHTKFDVAIRGQRYADSVGILFKDDGAAEDPRGVLWVDGHAHILEMDTGCLMEVSDRGYLNSNTLDLKIYDAVESVVMTVADDGEISRNTMRVMTQTGHNDRAGLNLRCDGQRNDMYFVCWDWRLEKLDETNYDGYQVLFTEASGANYFEGHISRALGHDKHAIIDLAPEIRRNKIIASDARVSEPLRAAIMPTAFTNFTFVGDQDDQLAWAASGRYTVTTSGATPPDATNVKRAFQPDVYGMLISDCTEAIITVDFGRRLTGNFMTGLLFYTDARLPDRVKVERSTDGSNWTTILQAGYDGEPVPLILNRYDGGQIGAADYLRLTVENDVATDFGLSRWVLGTAGLEKGYGAWLPAFSPDVYGSIDIVNPGGSSGYYIDGTRVVNTQQAAIADSVGSDEQTKINAILAAMRAHGLIAT